MSAPTLSVLCRTCHQLIDVRMRRGEQCVACHTAPVSSPPGERTVVEWQDHWKTWTINHGYYGVIEDTDRDRTCWSVEWIVTLELARQIEARADAIDALVRLHVPADKGGNRRVRLDIRLAEGQLVVREYDFARWSDTLPV